MLTASRWTSRLLGIQERTINPLKDEAIRNIMQIEDIHRIQSSLKQLDHKNSSIQIPVRIKIHQEYQNYIFKGKAFFNENSTELYSLFGFFYEKQHNVQTPLIDQIDQIIVQHPEKDYMMCIIESHKDLYDLLLSYCLKENIMEMKQYEYILFVPYQQHNQKHIDDLMEVLTQNPDVLGLGISVFPKDGKTGHDLFFKAILNMKIKE